jgi:hypothetical protein
MSKRKDIIDLFDSISKFNTYSKYSNSLKKIFKNKSLKDYIKSLKNPIHIDSFQFITDFDKRTKKEEEDDPFNLLPKGYLKKGRELDLLHEESNPEENKDDTKNVLKNNITKTAMNFNNISLIKQNQELDPFKYNPNYNSIYKNIHSFKIILPKSKPIIKKNSKSEILLKGIKNSKNNIIKNIKKFKIKIKESNINSDNEKNNNSQNNIKSRNFKTLPVLNSDSFKAKNKNKKKGKIKYDNNHAFRFSKYIPRKINIYKVNNRLTYLEPNFNIPSNKNNKAIDFNKMENRNSNRWVNLAALTNPSFYYYNPNYNYFEKKPLKILFNPKDYEKKNKKYIIKKIWASYDVKKEYESIDNDKLK